MEEKILVKSEKYDVKKLFQIFVIVGLAISLLWGMVIFIAAASDYHESYVSDGGHTHNSYCLKPQYYDGWYTEFEFDNRLYAFNETGYRERIPEGTESFYYDSIGSSAKNFKDLFDCAPAKYGSGLGYAFAEFFRQFFLLLLPTAAMAVIGALVALWLKSYRLTVTEKGVTGEIVFGKQVDLPLDSVSAISTVPLLKGVSISTSSGKIGFFAIKNAAEIYKVVNELLSKRQEKKAEPVTAPAAPAVDETEQLKKYKELLDMGIITQEEFNAKKKQLLGL